MQREVTLYKVEEERVMAYDTVSFYRQHRFDPNATPVNADLTLATVERCVAPVRRYVESMMVPDEHDEYKVAHKESFIAIDPKLDWMIQQPLLDQLDTVDRRAKAAMKEISLYQDRIISYNNLPWYKRIFKKV